MSSRHFVHTKIFNHTQQESHALTASLANSITEIQQAFKLRQLLTTENRYSAVSDANEFLDRDNFDVHSRHLVVKNGRQVVATARLCTREHVEEIGRFYSSTKFDIESIVDQAGNLLEVSRISIHPDYQDGTALEMLWHGVAQFCDDKQIDLVIGDVSIPLKYGYTQAVIETLRQHYPANKHYHVQPRVPLARMESSRVTSAIMPTLLHSYLHRGARLCGATHWDAVASTAEVLLILAPTQLSSALSRHFA